MRVILVAIAIVLIVGAYVLWPAEPSAQNVIVITVDTLRADRLGCYGYDDIETPNIDAFAAGGVVFLDASAATPFTLPSHASILTGLNPNRHGARQNFTTKLEEPIVTLAELLEARGYQTAASVATATLASRFGLTQGFGVYDDKLHDDSWPTNEKRAEQAVGFAVGWLSAAQEPFFLWLHLFDPHAAYDPPPPFDERYQGRPYDGEVAYVDYALGELFGFLDEQGLSERTIIVFTADHGESLGEHGYQGHGKWLYQPTLHIPLIVAHPATLPRGRVVETHVRAVDIVPTILDLLQIDAPYQLDGTSLRPLVTGGEGPAVSYAETTRSVTNVGLDSLRNGRWKYIRFRPGTGSHGEQLFDLDTDPGELNDLSESDGVRTQQLAQGLIHFLDESARLPTTESPELEIDPETKEQMRRLGYLE